MKLITTIFFMLFSLIAFANELDCTLGLTGQNYVDAVIPMNNSAFGDFIENDKISVKVSGYKTEQADAVYEVDLEVFDKVLDSRTTIHKFEISIKKPILQYSQMMGKKKVDGIKFRSTSLTCHFKA